jgi:NAD(P)-dependent dehydrogenase (short-subunit alcohol dehydrogenase family)
LQLHRGIVLETMDPLIEKVALVTGGARHNGRAIALALAQQGWDIAVHYCVSESDADAAGAALAVAAEIEALGRRALTLQCNLADHAAVSALLQQAAALGPVSCVVNNASLAYYDAAIGFDAGLLDRHMQFNLAAPLLLAQALHAATPDGAQAVVINLLDQKLFNLNPDFLSYTLSKAALHTATTMLAQALAPKLRVVGIAPGIALPLGHSGAIALCTSSKPEDVAAAVCYAASATAITGATLLVDRGQHLVPAPRDAVG